MSLPVDVWSDFVCPWCFLAAQSLEQLKSSHRVAIHWRAYELRPEGSPPMSPEHLERIKASRPRLYAIAQEVYGLKLNQGPFGINTRTALIGMKYAESQGKGHKYHDAVFRAYWQEALPIDDLHILAKFATNIGLDSKAFLAALQDESLKDAVLADEEQAYAHGLSGVPAMVFAGRYLVSGAQSYEALKDIVEQIEAGAVG